MPDISIALCAPRSSATRVFDENQMSRLAKLGNIIDARFLKSVSEVIEQLAPAEILLSTWGMPFIDEAFLKKMPLLRGIFYAAGSIKGLVTPEMYAKGIVISSAAPMNAVPVAEYTVAVIILSGKRFWQQMQPRRTMQTIDKDQLGNYRITVGIIAASRVGRKVIRLLQNYDIKVLLYDPLVSAEEASRLGVNKVDLPELMTRSDIVSLHAPNLPQLRHMINAEMLKLMKDDATFINTARGALVDENALIAELQTGRIWAVLDVTDPEPPQESSPLYSLPNVILTPHIAGSMGNELRRIGEFAIDELERFINNKPLQNAVPYESLPYLA